MAESGDPIYDLLLPFVVCKSEGGPYDDEAFVAGFRLGQLDLRMHGHGPVDGIAIHPAEVGQVDLIAMRHGYRVTVEDHDDEWSLCTFEQVGLDAAWPGI